MGRDTTPLGLRLDQLLREARKLGQPDAIGAPAAAKLAGDLGPTTTTWHRLTAYPRDEDWFTTMWDTQATEKNFPDPKSIMGIHRALRIPTRDIVLAAAATTGIPDVWRDPSEISRARLPEGWDRLDEHRWAVVRDVVTEIGDEVVDIDATVPASVVRVALAAIRAVVPEVVP